jgi:hypothetical protein
MIDPTCAYAGISSSVNDSLTAEDTGKSPVKKFTHCVSAGNQRGQFSTRPEELSIGRLIGETKIL